MVPVGLPFMLQTLLGVVVVRPPDVEALLYNMLVFVGYGPRRAPSLAKKLSWCLDSMLTTVGSLVTDPVGLHSPTPLLTNSDMASTFPSTFPSRYALDSIADLLRWHVLYADAWLRGLCRGCTASSAFTWLVPLCGAPR